MKAAILCRLAQTCNSSLSTIANDNLQHLLADSSSHHYSNHFFRRPNIHTSGSTPVPQQFLTTPDRTLFLSQIATKTDFQNLRFLPIRRGADPSSSAVAIACTFLKCAFRPPANLHTSFLVNDSSNHCSSLSGNCRRICPDAHLPHNQVVFQWIPGAYTSTW